MVNALPALGRIVEQATYSLRNPGHPPSPGLNALFNAGPEAEREIYITFGEGRLYLINAQAPTEDLNETAVERLRTLIEETRVEVPGVNVGDPARSENPTPPASGNTPANDQSNALRSSLKGGPGSGLSSAGLIPRPV